MGLTRPRAYQIFDIDYKQAVRVITLTNINLSGGAPNQVDGVNLTLNDRVLVAGQSTGSQNGLYYVTTVGTGANGTWQRSIDGNETGEIQAGMIVMVTEGTTYADTQWKLITNNPITIGSTTLTFEQTSAYSFGSIAVSGQNSIVADTVGDVLTVVAGNNIALTTDSITDALTISVTGISLNSISNGSSNVNVVSSGGNVTVGVAGTANVLSIANTSITAKANLLPEANVTYSLGSSTQRWKDLWISNSTIYIGETNISASGNTLIVGGANVVTQTPDGNVSGANITTTGAVSATGNVSGGNLTTVGQVTASGNITGNYFIGNGSQLSGIAAGDTIGGNLIILTRGGNVNFAVTAGYLVVNTRATGNVSFALAA